MASLNVARRGPTTMEGGASTPLKPLEELRRSVMTCLLWEDGFYEKGNATAMRMAALVAACRPSDVAALAVEARQKFYLRHVPLFLVRELARVKGNGSLVEATLRLVIERPDELSEYLTLYWKDGRCPISAGSKRGLRAAFTKFTPYQLAKYRKEDKGVKLVDVLRVVRPTPKTPEQQETFKALRAGTLTAPDTWEVALSAGADKKETFERLLREKKLGGLATLRNLRNMQEARVDMDLVRERLADPMPKVWPYRFVTAAKYARPLEDALEGAMFRAVEQMATLPGKTGLLVDVSGSMNDRLSAKSGDTTRMDVASGLAILLREKTQQLAVATFSHQLKVVAPRRGFALRDAIVNSQPHGGTYLRAALDALKKDVAGWATLDRLIVITDEQSADGTLQAWAPKAYIINVAANAHGVGYDRGWTHVHGWSERVFDYMQESER